MSENSSNAQARDGSIVTARPTARQSTVVGPDRSWRRHDQVVAEPLMVPLRMVVRHE